MLIFEFSISGYYIEASLPEEVRNYSVERLAHDIRIDFTNGVGDTGIKLGVIGEIGCSWPLTGTNYLKSQAKCVILYIKPFWKFYCSSLKTLKFVKFC